MAIVKSRFPYNIKSYRSDADTTPNNNKIEINNPASIFLGIWRWIRRFHITKHASTTLHFHNFLISKSKRNFCPNVEIADRMPTQRQQQAKSTINNPASIFLGLWCRIRRFDITKHAFTTSHFRNFLMSQSKRDILSERRNRRSNADATPTTSKINNQ